MPSVVGVEVAGLAADVDDERDTDNPDKLLGNFIRGMKLVFGVVTTGVLVVASRVGVVGVPSAVVSGVCSIAVGGGVDGVWISVSGLGGAEEDGSEGASTNSSSSSSSSSDERPPSSWKSGPAW